MGALKSDDVKNDALFQYDWLQQATNQPSQATMVLIKLRDRQIKQQLIQQMKTKLPRLHIDSRTAMEVNRENIDGLRPVMQGFSFIILIGSALLVISTLQMSLYERKRELATFRPIGAQKHQLFRMMVIEGLIIGMLSLVGGFIIGLAISRLLLWTVKEGSISHWHHSRSHMTACC